MSRAAHGSILAEVVPYLHRPPSDDSDPSNLPVMPAQRGQVDMPMTALMYYYHVHRAQSDGAVS